MRLCKANMEFFEKNIDIIKEKNKYLGEKIDILNIDNNKMGITETTRNNKIPWIVKDARRWFLNSRIDSDEAACIYAERYDVCMYGIYFIFGFSDGKHIHEILKKCSFGVRFTTGFISNSSSPQELTPMLNATNNEVANNLNAFIIFYY